MERRRILLVDDEPCLLDICREVLTDRGYEVFTASNGKRALPILQTGDIDCAVLDQRMPEMGGMELMREICRLGIDVRITSYNVCYTKLLRHSTAFSTPP